MENLYKAVATLANAMEQCQNGNSVDMVTLFDATNNLLKVVYGLDSQEPKKQKLERDEDEISTVVEATNLDLYNSEEEDDKTPCIPKDSKSLSVRKAYRDAFFEANMCTEALHLKRRYNENVIERGLEPSLAYDMVEAENQLMDAAAAHAAAVYACHMARVVYKDT